MGYADSSLDQDRNQDFFGGDSKKLTTFSAIFICGGGGELKMKKAVAVVWTTLKVAWCTLLIAWADQPDCLG